MPRPATIANADGVRRDGPIADAALAARRCPFNAGARVLAPITVVALAAETLARVHLAPVVFGAAARVGAVGPPFVGVQADAAEQNIAPGTSTHVVAAKAAILAGGAPPVDAGARWTLCGGGGGEEQEEERTRDHLVKGRGTAHGGSRVGWLVGWFLCWLKDCLLTNI